MGQSLNSLWAEQFFLRHKDTRAIHGSLPSSATARVIAGAAHGVAVNAKKRPKSVGFAGDCGLDSSYLAHAGKTAVRPHLPFIRSISPAMLATTSADLLLISIIFFGVSTITAHQLSSPILASYLVAYALVGIQVGRYPNSATSAHSFSSQAEAVAIATLLAILALALSPTNNTNALALFLWSGGNWLALSVWHEVKRSRNKAASGIRRVMIIGSPAMGQVLFDNLRQTDSVRDVREFLLDRCLLEPHGAVLMGRIARQACIDEVIIATEQPTIIKAALGAAKSNCLDAYVAFDLSGTQMLACENVSGVSLLKVSEHRLPEWTLTGKRVFDVAFSSVSLGILLPILALIGLLIKIESPGPALYRAERVGRKGRRFTCYKFRTMVHAADAMKQGLRRHNQRRGAFFKIADDPRTTRIGRYLRRYSIDELPQLWNVLRGDMSLVGPRPHPPDDVAQYSIGDLRRLDFVPGMTGLWQVIARQDPSFQRCVDLDVEYIERWSLSLDFRILCRTIGVVLQGTGA